MGSPVAAQPLRAVKPWICSSCRRLRSSQQASRSRQPISYQWTTGPLRNASSAARAAPSKQRSFADILSSAEEHSPPSLANIRELFQDQLHVTVGTDAQEQEDPYGLLSALRNKNFDAISAAVARASTDPVYFRHIPKTTWTEILRGLAPSNTLLPLHRIHTSFDTRQLRQAGYEHSTRLSSYIDTLVNIVRLRREHEIFCDIVDYQILLKHVAAVGHVPTARIFWRSMRRDGVRPDRVCYNAYLEAIIWNEKSRVKRRRRLTPYARPRSQSASDIALFLSDNVSGTVNEVIEQMTASKIAPDIDTYCALITGLARDSDVDAIWTILSNLWGIDPNILNDEDGQGTPRFMVAANSLTYPNSKLLVTLAEAFGSMNEIVTSVNLVVCFRRHYHLDMPLSVWYHTSKWIWLQSRFKPDKRVNTSAETLPMQAIEDTAQIMQNTFGVEPSMEQLDVFFQATDNPFTHRSSLEHRLGLLEEGLTQYRKRRRQWHHHVQWNPQLSVLRHEQLQTKARLSHQLLQRWCRSLIGSAGTPDVQGETPTHIIGWRLRGVPHLLLQYSDFCPRNVVYAINSGKVELRFRTDRDIRKDRSRKLSGVIDQADDNLELSHESEGFDQPIEQQFLEESEATTRKRARGETVELPNDFWRSNQLGMN